MEIDRAAYDAQKGPRFGRANPERMFMPFWEMMVRNAHNAFWARQHFRDRIALDVEPVWCFDRFGMSRTELSDHRVICVAGEHEDCYDPDFYIYNDVVVLNPGGDVEIYGYPKDVFPPTDFHTATLVHRDLLLLGSLGYLNERVPGTTPVYRLDSKTFQIERVATRGTGPGWISRHEATLDLPNDSITIRGGRVFEWTGWTKSQAYRENNAVFRLKLSNFTWVRE